MKIKPLRPDYGKRAFAGIAVVGMLGCSMMAGCSIPSGPDEKSCMTYSRQDFGYQADLDGDGCFTRAELLMARSLIPVSMDSGSNCRVLRGAWQDAYSGDTLYSSDSVEIDHLVPLKEAFTSGADRWPSERKRIFANTDSLDQLVVARASTNHSKGSRDIGAWQPESKQAKIRYALSWARIKVAWELTADAKELGALKAILGETHVVLPLEAEEPPCP